MATIIRRLAYVSRPSPGLSASEISKIIATSRTNNARTGICGVLVYAGNNFAQLIEGPPENVATLWRCIRADHRHVEITALLDEPDTVAWFPEWRVGYLTDRNAAEMLTEWRSLRHGIDHAGRGTLRSLLASADAM